MSSQRRPRLDQDASSRLEAFKEMVGFRLIHEAEKHVLKDNRREITESDIQKAEKIIPRISTDKRKWTVKIAMGVIIVLLFMHFQAFSELRDVPQFLQVRLYLPTIAMLVWLILFSYFFQEDWR